MTIGKIIRYSFISLAVIIVCAFVYFYLQNYQKCIYLSPKICVSSKKYSSVNGAFSFRYPSYYPLSYKSGKELMVQYGYGDKYMEWVNFSEEFYPNAGGDRLGTVIVEKNSQYSSADELVQNEYKNFEIPPVSEHVLIGGVDGMCSSVAAQPNTFSTSGIECVALYNDSIYRLSFDYNDYYHKEPFSKYEMGRKIILSTFTFNN